MPSSQMPMPAVEKRRSDIRIWIVAFLFMLFIISGGIILAMYMTLPESKDTAWYPIAGMVLVAIPWLFWLLTFLYRCCIKGDGGHPPVSPKPPSSDTSQPTESTRDCPDGTWPAAVEPQEGQGLQEQGKREEKEGDSPHSHESELPLALSMSPPS